MKDNGQTTRGIPCNTSHGDSGHVWLKETTCSAYGVLCHVVRTMQRIYIENNAMHLDILACAMLLVQLCPVGVASQAINRYGNSPEKPVGLIKPNMGLGFTFKTCDNRGRHGPTQSQCDAAYAGKGIKVKVLSENKMAGVQVWEVPKTESYSITALGAAGGTGVRNPDRAGGAFAHAVFNLTKGDLIYLVVGQQGQSACSQVPVYQTNTSHTRICRHWQHDTEEKGEFVGGGSGGGGGTFVYLYNKTTQILTPLIVAGGAGGKSILRGHSPIEAGGGISNSATGVSATSPIDAPGGGGGFSGRSALIQTGGSLLEGGVGGEPCPVAKAQGWEISGGFGGGGGGCKAGGGGGGFTGGNVSVTDNSEHNGQGGSSYINPDSTQARLEPAIHILDSGEVEIAFLLECACEYMCIYQDFDKKQFTCYCRPNHILSDDGVTCLDETQVKTAASKDTEPPVGVLVAAVVGGGAFLVLILLVIYCMAHQYKNKKQLKVFRLERLSNPDHQLGQLRAITSGPGHAVMTEYNPNYDFGGTKCSLEDLREVPRDSLNLVRALGQGAFGEVYQGYLLNTPTEPADLPVAVKTLPALCTDQAEMDFLMEALIMSKFNHANIVRFIGVCFEKHPRFIVLELLKGGDLKSFLRESRPKPDHPPNVMMMDLVKLSLDVALGCQYLEDNHFIHRDIAARNCLLTTKGPERIAKIADFGMARDIYRADYYRKGGKAMLPVKWMPPEAFLDGVFTSKTDVWSFGILLWEVFSLGYMPYPGRGNQEVMQFVTAGGRLEPPLNCPDPVCRVMTMCWHGIPERRPSFSGVIHQLTLCLQDPEVIHSPLPVFQRPPSDACMLRHADRDVRQDHMSPDSPQSTDHLLGSCSPNWRLSDQYGGPSRPANVSGSAESLDQLLSPGYTDMFAFHDHDADVSRGVVKVDVLEDPRADSGDGEDTVFIPSDSGQSSMSNLTHTSVSPPSPHASPLHRNSFNSSHLQENSPHGVTAAHNCKVSTCSQSPKHPTFNQGISSQDNVTLSPHDTDCLQGASTDSDPTYDHPAPTLPARVRSGSRQDSMDSCSLRAPVKSPQHTGSPGSVNKNTSNTQNCFQPDIRFHNL